ncbi:hypothetical protein AMTRI_Chr09g20940 [Amborella trichopoda]
MPSRSCGNKYSSISCTDEDFATFEYQPESEILAPKFTVTLLALCAKFDCSSCTEFGPLIALNLTHTMELVSHQSNYESRDLAARARHVAVDFPATFFTDHTGSAISAATNLATVTLSTETDGSIITPSKNGRPICRTVCRTVLDAVFVLDEIVGFDQRDKKATIGASKFIPAGGYKQFLKAEGLRGKRLGIPREPFFNFSGIFVLAQTFETHFKTLSRLPSPSRGFPALIQINGYLAQEKLKEYGQDIFILAESLNRSNSSQVRRAISNLKELSRNGIEKVMREKKLDAILAPANTPVYTILSIGGYPGITVLAGYDEEGVPFGICFGGLRGSEPNLIEIAYSFEQATHIRRPPTFKS